MVSAPCGQLVTFTSMLYSLYQLLILKQVRGNRRMLINTGLVKRLAGICNMGLWWLCVHFVSDNKQKWHYLYVYIENKEVKLDFSRMKHGCISCKNTMFIIGYSHMSLYMEIGLHTSLLQFTGMDNVLLKVTWLVIHV